MKTFCKNDNDVKTIYVLGNDCKFYDLQGTEYIGDLSNLEICCDCNEVTDPCEGIDCSGQCTGCAVGEICGCLLGDCKCLPDPLCEGVDCTNELLDCQGQKVCVGGTCACIETPCNEGICNPEDCVNCDGKCECGGNDTCICVFTDCPPTGCLPTDCDECAEGESCRCSEEGCKCLPDCDTNPCTSTDCTNCPEGESCVCQEDKTCQCEPISAPDPCDGVDCSNLTCSDNFTPECSGGICSCTPDCSTSGCPTGEVCTPSGCQNTDNSGEPGDPCQKEITLTECGDAPFANTPDDEPCPTVGVNVSCQTELVTDEFGNVTSVNYFNCVVDVNPGCGEIESTTIPTTAPDHSSGNPYNLSGDIILKGGCTYSIDVNPTGSTSVLLTSPDTANLENIEWIWTYNGSSESIWTNADSDYNSENSAGNNVILGDTLSVHVQSGNLNGSPCCRSEELVYDTCSCLNIEVDESTLDCDGDPNTISATVTNSMYLGSNSAPITVGGVVFNLAGGQSGSNTVNIESDGTIIYSAGDCTGIVEGFLRVEGCTDSTACNFNPEANCDDGSCLPNIEFTIDGAAECLEDGDNRTITINITQGTDVEYSFDNITFSSNNQTVIDAAGAYDACVRYIDPEVTCEVVKEMFTIESCEPKCPETIAQAPVADITIPTCTNNTGSVNVTSGCQAETTIQYSVDAVNWTATPPTYSDNLTIQTRCTCDNDSTISGSTNSITTPDELTFGCTDNVACNGGIFDCSDNSCEYCTCATTEPCGSNNACITGTTQLIGSDGSICGPCGNGDVVTCADPCQSCNSSNGNCEGPTSDDCGVCGGSANCTASIGGGSSALCPGDSSLYALSSASVSNCPGSITWTLDGVQIGTGPSESVSHNDISGSSGTLVMTYDPDCPGASGSQDSVTINKLNANDPACCTPNNCAASTCIGNTCDDDCGNMVDGTNSGSVTSNVSITLSGCNLLAEGEVSCDCCSDNNIGWTGSFTDASGSTGSSSGTTSCGFSTLQANLLNICSASLNQVATASVTVNSSCGSDTGSASFTITQADKDACGC